MCTKILSSPLIFSRIKTADMISVLRMGPWIFVVVPCFSCLPLTLTMQFPDSIFCSQSKRTKMSQDHFPKSAYPSLVNVCNRCTGDSRKNRHRWVEPTHNGQSWGGGGACRGILPFQSSNSPLLWLLPFSVYAIPAQRIGPHFKSSCYQSADSVSTGTAIAWSVRRFNHRCSTE